jgi:hypothetical protein
MGMNKKPTGGNVSFAELYESMDHVVEAKSMKVKTDKGEVSLKGNDSIEYEAKPGVVRIGMAGDVLKKGCKFKKDGTWHVMAESKRRHFIFTENGKVADLKDDQLKKLHGQMKDEQLSGSAASQFKGICREMKKRGMSLGEGRMAELGELIEGATENALKSLQAILGMFKDKHDNDIYKMGSGIMDYYKKEKSFSPDQAKWIWKTSVALFK